MKLSEIDIVKKLKEKFPDVTVDWVEPENGDKYLVVPTDKIDLIAKHLKESPELSFDFLMSVSAFDALKWGENLNYIDVTYHFYSYEHRHAFNVKTRPVRQGGEVNTISHLYGCANFQEREVFDHFGVKFNGHPDLRRILLPDDWVGYPLLKDYQEQEEYNGIATTRPSLL
jgi:NADH-quinone oxidoreductase subunit C